MTIDCGDQIEAAQRVSRETPDATIFDRMIEWSVWATGRLEIIDYYDNIVPHNPPTAARRAELAKIRRQDLTRGMHAIEKAVGRMRIQHPELHEAICLYFVKTRRIPNIAAIMSCGEDHVISFLRRGLRYLAVEVPRQEAELR